AESGKVVSELKDAGPRNPYDKGRARRQKFHGGAFSPDGKRFATEAGAGQLGVWEVASGKRLAVSPPPTSTFENPFTYITFSPDGKRIATDLCALTDHKVKVWDTETGALLCEPIRRMHSGQLFWYPDGSALVGYNNDPATVAVDVATEKVV